MFLVKMHATCDRKKKGDVMFKKMAVATSVMLTMTIAAPASACGPALHLDTSLKEYVLMTIKHPGGSLVGIGYPEWIRVVVDMDASLARTTKDIMTVRDCGGPQGKRVVFQVKVKPEGYDSDWFVVKIPVPRNTKRAIVRTCSTEDVEPDSKDPYKCLVYEGVYTGNPKRPVILAPKPDFDMQKF